MQQVTAEVWSDRPVHSVINTGHLFGSLRTYLQPLWPCYHWPWRGARARAFNSVERLVSFCAPEKSSGEVWSITSVCSWLPD